jgi:hypothetical protein
MIGGEFGEICWREKWNILGVMWKGVERSDFFIFVSKIMVI